MNLISSSGNISRVMACALVCTLIVAFGAIGSVLAGNFGDQYSLVGLFLGSALGAFIAVYESTIIGCMIGMLIGALISPVIYYFIDFETAYLAVFISSLIGAILGEPVASFWQEAEYPSSNEKLDERDNSEEKAENN
ncbi:MAG: hypothetical protein II567_14445 [Candidatus Riflebacteria bacterium]|nr:hypothetical protein [Candidatus Riflebacteria bacterium]